MFTTVVVLYAAKMIKTIQFQDFDRSILLKVSTLMQLSASKPLCLFLGDLVFQIFPLPLLYVGNHITGLASTKKLRFLLLLHAVRFFALWLLAFDPARVFSSLPMFTVLRKFTILMTMLLEIYILR